VAGRERKRGVSFLAACKITCGLVGLWVCGSVGLWVCGLVGSWAGGLVGLTPVGSVCGLVGSWARGREKQKARRVPLCEMPRWCTEAEGAPHCGSCGCPNQCKQQKKEVGKEDGKIRKYYLDYCAKCNDARKHQTVARDAKDGSWAGSAEATGARRVSPEPEMFVNVLNGGASLACTWNMTGKGQPPQQSAIAPKTLQHGKSSSS
jgi:hypothetical protein